jgi:hypothetical protein
MTSKMDRLRDETVDRLACKPGLRGKIDAMCVYCIYDPMVGGGTWKQQVKSCSSAQCPLHPIRVGAKR